jgi:hypothetical protein
MGLCIDFDIQYYLQGIFKQVVVTFLGFATYSGIHVKDGVQLNNLINRRVLAFISQDDCFSRNDRRLISYYA